MTPLADARPAADDTLPETRLRSETGLAARVADIVEPVIEDLGFRLVRVRVTSHNGATVQIMIERPDGSLEIDDCASVSRVLSPLLDIEDPLPGGYHLEVSSPGIDRPLARPIDFERWAGFEARIELTEMLAGRKRFRGILEGYLDGEVRIEMDLDDYDTPQVIGIPFNLIDTAKLVMTDDLLKRAAPEPSAPARDAD